MLSANKTQAWYKIVNKNNPLQFARKQYFAFILICDDGKLRYNRMASGRRQMQVIYLLAKISLQKDALMLPQGN